CTVPNRPPITLMRFAAAVGTVSQLMIFTEPASAVSQPRPTLAAPDNTANTATKISTEHAEATANAVAWPYWRRSRSWRTHTHTKNGSASAAVALTATPTATTAIPDTGCRSNVNAMPAIIKPTINI